MGILFWPSSSGGDVVLARVYCGKRFYVEGLITLASHVTYLDVLGAAIDLHGYDREFDCYVLIHEGRCIDVENIGYDVGN